MDRVLREFFHNCNGVWSHKRADKELEKFRALSEQQRQRVMKRYQQPTQIIPTVGEALPTGYQEPYTGAGIPTNNQIIPPLPPASGARLLAQPGRFRWIGSQDCLWSLMFLSFAKDGWDGLSTGKPSKSQST